LGVGLPPIYGHEPLLSRLAGAVASGRFPQATVFVGPPGVGKQRIALWVAQALLCEADGDRPCGQCQSCHQALGLSHPDLHWFVPILRPKTPDPDKQVDEAAALIGETVAERRENALYGPPEPMASHPLASIRLLQRRVALKPFQGSCTVIVLGNAERLVVQEASQEAANALLKVLEEPPPGTFLMLTARETRTLLPTIRSRLVPVRVGGVGDETVRQFLMHELHPPPSGAQLEQRVLLAEGSIGRALSVTAGQATNGAADRLLAAVRGGPAAWAAAALAQPPWEARGDFTGALDGVLVRLRNAAARDCTAQVSRVPRWIAAIRAVEQVRAEAQGNVNPQLALATLAHTLETLA
jgi:DNA polymerase-3 subunit delta'